MRWNKRTRLQMTRFACVFLAVTTYSAIYYQMEGLASTCVAGILTITSVFVGGDSYRPSKTEDR